MNKTQIREAGIICVYQSLVLNKDIYFIINNQIEDEKLKSDLFFLNITANLFEHLDYVKNVIKDKLDNWSFDRLGYIEQAILLVGTVELLSEDVDKAVVIDEAIKYAKKYAEFDSYKLINGVLDQVWAKSGPQKLY